MRLTIPDLQKMKSNQEKLVMLTAYDAVSASLSELAGVPMLLVGDTVGMVIQGHDSTIPVTLDEMVYHCKIVSRVTHRSFVVGDLPFMSYSISAEQAMASAARLMQEGGVNAVKLEGGEFIAPTISRITRAGIPVVAHIGLTPQSVNTFGGFRVQGRDFDNAKQLIQDAKVVQDAGAFAVVLELVPMRLAEIITNQLDIPTIGIGAGAGCDGQVQVFHDILGLFEKFVPRHAKQYAQLGETIRNVIETYIVEVKSGDFPTEEHAFKMSDEVIQAIKAEFPLES